MKKIILRLAVVFVMISLLCGTVWFICIRQNNREEQNYSEKSGSSSEPEPTGTTEKKETEMRAVWIPFMSLQLSEEERNREGFEKKISEMFDNCVSHKLNTVIVHVRPFGDAIYPSEYFPWTHILSGEQGKGLSFDPLECITEQAHKRGLAVHAWINPLRISTGKTPPKLSKDNPYEKWKNKEGYFFKYNDGIYYDPSNPEVRELIINGARELAQKYDIDGVQIDDYFYPEEMTGYDRNAYDKYKASVANGYKPLSIEEWRKNNINMLISGMYDAVHSAGKGIVFGISPQCNFDNNEKMSADIISWCTSGGYADYICPQLYVTNEHPVFPFDELANKWIQVVKNKDIRLYFGLGLYKAGTDADSGTWLKSSNNISEQISSLRQKGANGFMLYSYEFLDKPETQEEVKNAMAEMELMNNE